MTPSEQRECPESVVVNVVQQRPGWRAIASVDGVAHEATGGTIHSAITKALADARLICRHHLSAARTGCRS